MQKNRETLLTFFAILLFVVFSGAALFGVMAKDKETAPLAGNREKQNQCNDCHEIRPEVLTWQISSHSKIPCTKCHEVEPAKYQTKTDRKSVNKPIRISNAIPNSVCEQCHTSNRVTTASGDLIIPHEKHSAAGVLCVKCHSGVVHARIADRDLKFEGVPVSYELWDLEVARRVATKPYLQPSMWTCIACHRQAKVTRRCSACHTEIISLPSHENPTWSSQHGKSAQANVGECTKCHVTPGLPKFISPSTGNTAADFARAQQFCYSCHLLRPQMHEKSMIPIHPVKAAERGLQNCLTCHNREKPKAGEKVTATYCNQCHWMQSPPQTQTPAPTTSSP